LIDKDSSTKLFHAVTPHGLNKDTIILASTKNFSTTVRRCRYDLTAVIQETFSWIEDSDIFATPRPPRVIMSTENPPNHEEREKQLESLFGFYKEDFPSLSDLEDDSDDNCADPPTNQSAWAKGPPPFNPADEQIEVSSFGGYSLNSKARSRPKKSNKNKKARINVRSSNCYNSGSAQRQ
jgi:hypothetical protein